METFLEKIAEILEVEPGDITMDTVFREITVFDSMMGFMIICMIADEYHVTITVDEFLACKTILDLYNKATRVG